jgi:hypothetical protein
VIVYDQPQLDSTPSVALETIVRLRPGPETEPGTLPRLRGQLNRHPYAVRFELHPIHQLGNRGGLFGFCLKAVTHRFRNFVEKLAL